MERLDARVQHRPDLESHGARRAERTAVAMALLNAPPPLEALAPRRVHVRTTAVVHASRSRPVVRWELDVELEDHSTRTLAVIGKAFHKGGGHEAWLLLGRLRAAGFDVPGRSVPEPYGWDGARRLLAQEEAPPRTLHDTLVDSPAAGLPDVQRVAAWLAGLHSTPVEGLPVLPRDFEARKLGEYGEALYDALPGEAARIRALLAGTLSGLAAVDGPNVATHGDFQPKNVHLDHTRLTVIDFDRAALAPAARDLGHFVGQSQTMLAAREGEPVSTGAWVRGFLDAYVHAGGSPDAAREASAYAARTYAEVLFYRLVVRPMGTHAFVPGWLDAWERWLAEGVS